jgi:hypothetical protein
VNASDALREFLAGLRTEPLSVCDLARYFGMSRNAVRPDLLPTLDVEMVGSRYRVALRCMPLSYFRDIEHLHRFAQNCTDTNGTSHEQSESE